MSCVQLPSFCHVALWASCVDTFVISTATLLLAGHDTTAISITWLLWELAKHPEYQTKIREELVIARAEATARGDSDFSIADLEGLTMLQAALKVCTQRSHLSSKSDSGLMRSLSGLQEGMRLHPIVWTLVRAAGRDDVIPLAYPITSKSGEQISAIPVSKGQSIQLSICTYNR